MNAMTRQLIAAFFVLAAIATADAVLLLRLTPMQWRCEIERRASGSRSPSARCPDLGDPIALGPMLYEAAIDSIYTPGKNLPVWSEHARVLLAAQTQAPSRILTQSGVWRELRRVLGDSLSVELAARFVAVNAQPVALKRYLQASPRWIFLDSVEVNRRLAHPDSVAGIRLGIERSERPPVLAFSSPGVSLDGATALLYAILRSPDADQPDHVVARALLVLSHDGTRWHVRDEIPVDGADSTRR